MRKAKASRPPTDTHAAAGRFTETSATSIWRAAEYGDLSRLQLLLRHGCDINAQCDAPGWRKKTPLSSAVDGNEPLAVRFLLQRGADPNLQDGDGDRYPLHWCAAFGDHAECAQLLLQAGARLDVVDASGATPREFARAVGGGPLGLSSRRPRVLQLLQAAEEESARPEWSAALAAERLAPAFWKAAQRGEVDVLERCLLQGQPIDQLRPSKQHRMSALGVAVLHGQLHAASFLVSRRADVNLASEGMALSPLHLASHHADHLECATLLLRARASALAKASNGDTPLAWATRHERPQVAAVLQVAEAQQRAEEELRAAMAPSWLPGREKSLAAAVQQAVRAGAEVELVQRGEAMLRELHANAGGGVNQLSSALEWLWGQAAGGGVHPTHRAQETAAADDVAVGVRGGCAMELVNLAQAVPAMEEGRVPAEEGSVPAEEGSVPPVDEAGAALEAPPEAREPPLAAAQLSNDGVEGSSDIHSASVSSAEQVSSADHASSGQESLVDVADYMHSNSSDACKEDDASDGEQGKSADMAGGETDDSHEELTVVVVSRGEDEPCA
ncbi:hypothetical protein AB1Y20_003287 [Prymnesium parvum]|uniref:Uncharacterized protein n=1 Tax=Prymnesium parvum TaxID=97485 RepID=A0AB34JBF4_PRYPA